MYCIIIVVVRHQHQTVVKYNNKSNQQVASNSIIIIVVVRHQSPTVAKYNNKQQVARNAMFCIIVVVGFSSHIFAQILSSFLCCRFTFLVTLSPRLRVTRGFLVNPSMLFLYQKALLLGFFFFFNMLSLSLSLSLNQCDQIKIAKCL